MTTKGLAQLVPHVAKMGFDLIEVPVEEPDAYDYARTADMIRDHNLDVSVVAAMAPDRDLIHPEKEIRGSCSSSMRRPDLSVGCAIFQVAGCCCRLGKCPERWSTASERWSVSNQ